MLMPDTSHPYDKWIDKLDHRVDDLMTSVQIDDLTRAGWAVDSLRSWLTMLEVMLMESTSDSMSPDVFGRYATRLAMIDARLRSIQWLIEHKRKPWYLRFLPVLGRVGQFLLDRLGFGPFLPRLPGGK
jgi:hypothetical protein